MSHLWISNSDVLCETFVTITCGVAVFIARLWRGKTA